MTSKLLGVHAKLRRADAHIETLRAQLFAAMGGPEGEAFRAGFRYETYDGHPAVTLFVTKLPTFPLEISVLMGEIVHDLRSGLDQLAWALIPPPIRRQLKPGAAQQIYFPMAGSRRNFDNRVNQWLPGTTSDQRRFIQLYQPYHRSAEGRAMRTLRNLSNTDKHRVLVPALFFPLTHSTKVDFKKGPRRLAKVVRIARGHQMQLRSDLLTWTFSEQPEIVKIDYKIANSPGFHPRLVRPAPGNDLEDVGGTLKTIAAACRQIVAHFDV